MDPERVAELEREFGMERAIASQRIIQLSEKHEKEIARKSKELKKKMKAQNEGARDGKKMSWEK